MAKFIDVEVWVCMNANSDYVVGIDEDALKEKYEEDIGGDAGVPRRTIKVTLKVPVPEVVELTGEVPIEGDATLKVVA